MSWIQGAVHAFRPEEFFGREEELASLERACLGGRRGAGSAVMLHGPPGVGKTSLLLRLGLALAGCPAEPGLPRPFPFHFPFSRIQARPSTLSEQFLHEYLAQLLAFLGETPPAASDAQEMCDRLALRGLSFCRDSLAAHRRHLERGDDLAALANAFSFPFTTASESLYPVFLLDDFHHAGMLEGVPDGAVLSILRPFLRAARHPVVLAVESPGRLSASLAREGLHGAFQVLEAGELSREAAEAMWSAQCGSRDIRMPRELHARVAARLGGRPVYHRMFAEEVGFRGADPLDGVALENLYAFSVTEGRLNRYWRELLEDAIPERGRRTRAVRFLKRVLCDRIPPDTVEGALSLLGGSGDGAAAILDALELKGLLKTELERVEFHRDPVLADFLRWGHERGAMGKSSSRVAAGIVRERLSDVAAERGRGERERWLASVTELLRRWDCREVPSLLFDFPAFLRKFGGKGLLEVVVGMEREQRRERLPRIGSVSGRHRPHGTGRAPEFDLVAYGFPDDDYSPEKMVAWAVDVVAGERLSRETVEHFGNRCRLLSIEEGVPQERLRKWIVFDGPADPGATAAAGEHGVFLSHASQMRLFLNQFGMEELPDEPAEEPAARAGNGAEAEEFELVLPAKSDAEAVAVRVAEEVAGHTALAPEEVDRVKMAIVEACIDAFEQGAAESGRVRLRYVLAPGKVEIHVRGEGRGMRAAGGDAKGGESRGWGLRLIRELVDDVEIVAGDGGTAIRMVKFTG